MRSDVVLDHHGRLDVVIDRHVERAAGQRPVVGFRIDDVSAELDGERTGLGGHEGRRPKGSGGTKRKDFLHQDSSQEANDPVVSIDRDAR